MVIAIVFSAWLFLAGVCVTPVFAAQHDSTYDSPEGHTLFPIPGLTIDHLLDGNPDTPDTLGDTEDTDLDPDFTGTLFEFAPPSEYTMTYDWTGDPSVGFAGWGAGSTDPDWYNVDIGSTVRGIRITPVGGKVYGSRAMNDPDAPHGQAIFGAPGAEIGDGTGSVRIKKAVFSGAFHRNDNHFQALRTALYGPGIGVVKDSVGTDDVLKNGGITVEDRNITSKATTAQIWLHTTPDGMRPSSVLIPNPNTTFGQVGNIVFTLVDSEKPATQMHSKLFTQPSRWIQARTPTTLTTIAQDRGSGVRNLRVDTSHNGGAFTKLTDLLVPCDFNHTQTTWKNIECPHKTTHQIVLNPQNLHEGKTIFRATSIDRAKINAPPVTTDVFIDRSTPNINDPVRLGDVVRQLRGWQTLEKPITFTLPLYDRLSGVVHAEIDGINVRNQDETLLEKTLCDLGKLKPGQSCPHQITQTFQLTKNLLEDNAITGTYQLRLTLKDAAGNESVTPLGTLSFDNDPPSTPTHLTLEPLPTTMLIRWGSSLDTSDGSGFDSYMYRYQINSNTLTPWRPLKSTYLKINGLQSNDLVRFEIFAKDRVGHRSETAHVEGRTKRISPKTPFPKPCTTRRCKPKPSCHTHGNTRRCQTPHRKPQRIQKVPKELKPCTTRKPTPSCTLNLYLRGIELVQGPTGKTLVEQPAPHRTDLFTTSYRTNATSLFYDIESTDDPNLNGYQATGSYRAAPKLITNKGTLARVYTSFDGVHAAPNAQVILTGLTRNTNGQLVQLGEFRSQLHQTQPATTMLQTLREEPDSQATFPIPPTWTTTPNLILHARVIPQPGMRECDTCNDQANHIELQDITFQQPTPGKTPTGQPTTQAPITLHRIYWTGNPRTPTDQEIQQSLNIMRALYPLARDQIHIEIDPKPREITGVPLDKDGTVDCSKLYSQYKELVPSWFEPTNDGQQNDVYARHIGVIQPDANISGCSGKASLGGYTGIAQVGAYSTTLAHEVGHNYGRPHASPNNGADHDPKDHTIKQDFEPWPDGLNPASSNGMGSINGIWFWRPALGRTTLPIDDLGRLTTYSVHDKDDFAGDMMSYNLFPGGDLFDEPDTFTSPNTWNALLDGFTAFPSCNGSECEQEIQTPASKPTKPAKLVSHLNTTPQHLSPQPSTPGSELIVDPAQPHDRILFFAFSIRPDGTTINGFDDFIEAFGKPDPPNYDPFKNRRFLKPEPGWHFVAYDANDTIVLDLPVGSPPEADGDPQLISFETRLLLPASAVKLQFKANDQVLVERTMNPNPPSIRITSPKAGERWWYDPNTKKVYSSTGKPPRVSWETEDPDGDKVNVSQGYSYAPGAYEMLGEDPGSPLSFPSETNSMIPGVSGMTPSKEGRIALKFSDGWYSGMILGPKITVEPRTFGKNDVQIGGPQPYTDRFGMMSFYATALDPNTNTTLDDEYTKPSPYAWYYKGKLFSRKNEFSTTRFRCSKKTKYTFTLIIKGSYGAAYKKRITTRLTPAKIPPELKPLCKKTKKKQQ